MNLEGTTRKAMVKAISEITGESPVYKFTPIYAFEIGDIIVSRYGEIACPDDSNIIERLKEKGFKPESEPSTEQDVVYTDTDLYTEGDAGHFHRASKRPLSRRAGGPERPCGQQGNAAQAFRQSGGTAA